MTWLVNTTGFMLCAGVDVLRSDSGQDICVLVDRNG